MSLELCHTCRTIPDHIWLIPWRPDEQPVDLQPLNDLRKSAAKGCYLCCFFSKAINASRSESTVPGYRIIVQSTSGNVKLSKTIFGRPGHLLLTLGTNLDIHMTGYEMPEPWCDIQPPQDLMGPINNVRLMKTWLADCVANHSNCSRQSTTFLPSRLLDVNPLGTEGVVKLVSSLSLKSKDIPKYVTLSHCWGPVAKRTIKTKRDNLESHMDAIPLSILPNTFRDAVDVTRQLGIQYIWIDSLCIVQNDQNDWAKEAALMADIYENAFCTLSALSSKDSTYGCRQVVDIQDTVGEFADIDLPSQDGVRKRRMRLFLTGPTSWNSQYYGRYISDPIDDCFSVNPADDSYDASKTPLRFRAWTLQERELSRRLIHFANDQILWECRELKATAQLPWHEKSRLEARAWKESLYFPHIIPLNLKDPKMAKEKWHHIVDDFSLRSCTVGTDKLPALSGFAKREQSNFPESNYIAGMWAKNLPSSLLWRSLKQSARRYKTYIAPSWSWASLDGPITHQLGRADEMTEEIIYQEDAQYTFQDREKGFSPEGMFLPAKSVAALPWKEDIAPPVLLKAQTSPKYQDPYGAITSGSIVLANACIGQIEIGFDYQKRPFELFYLDGGANGRFHRDTVDDDITGHKIFVLRIEREAPRWRYWRGLLLMQVSEKQQTYKRIGLARRVPSGVFSEKRCIRSTITLI